MEKLEGEMKRTQGCLKCWLCVWASFWEFLFASSLLVEHTPSNGGLLSERLCLCKQVVGCFHTQMTTRQDSPVCLFCWSLQLELTFELIESGSQLIFKRRNMRPTHEGVYSITSSLGGRKTLICGVCWWPWCKYSHHSCHWTQSRKEMPSKLLYNPPTWQIQKNLTPGHR